MNIIPLVRTAQKKYRLTDLEQEQLEWAFGGLFDVLADEQFLSDNPGFESNTQAQWDNIYYRLENGLVVKARDTRSGSRERFNALHGESAAAKIRRIRREVSRETYPIGIRKAANDG